MCKSESRKFLIFKDRGTLVIQFLRKITNNNTTSVLSVLYYNRYLSMQNIRIYLYIISEADKIRRQINKIIPQNLLPTLPCPCLSIITTYQIPRPNFLINQFFPLITAKLFSIPEIILLKSSSLCAREIKCASYFEGGTIIPFSSIVEK